MYNFLPRKKLLDGISFFIVCFVFFFVLKVNSYAANLTFTPNSGNVSGNFDVVVFVDPESAQVSGTDAIIKYDPTKLEVTTITNGVFEQYLKKNINKTTGTIEISAYNTNVFLNVKSALATISFKTLVSEGSTYLTFVYTQGATSDSNVVAGEQDVLSTVSGGSYNLGSATGTGTPNATPNTSTTVESTQTATPNTGSTELLFLVPLLSLLFVGSGIYLFRSSL